jgi:DNA helicase MCM8
VHAGKLVTIRGTVTRMSAIRPLVTDMEFACAKCGTIARCAFPDGKFTPPGACPGEGCRGRSFTPLRGSAHSVDWQKIRVQARACADSRASPVRLKRQPTPVA